MIDKGAYDLLLTYRVSSGEYKGSPFRNVEEFKRWVMENVDFSKQELVNMMGKTARGGNNG